MRTPHNRLRTLGVRLGLSVQFGLFCALVSSHVHRKFLVREYVNSVKHSTYSLISKPGRQVTSIMLKEHTLTGGKKNRMTPLRFSIFFNNVNGEAGKASQEVVGMSQFNCHDSK